MNPALLVDTDSVFSGNISDGVLKMSNATGIDTSAPKCNLCANPHLFVVSVGGRTGSTTVLNMLNAIPHVRLAGENGGQIEYLSDLYETAAHVLNKHNGELYCSSPNNEAGDCGAYQRGSISPTNVLCDLQQYVNDIAVPVFPLLPKPEVSVRGFKDIRWTTETIALLHTIFPCARVVYSVRNNNNDSAVIESYQKDFHLSEADAATYAHEQVLLQDTVKVQHDADASGGNGWKSFWLPLETMDNSTSFNALLNWMGVRNCHFTEVVYANNQHIAGAAAGYGVAGGTTFDALRALKGNCSFPF